jgi:hypothetical protein
MLPPIPPPALPPRLPPICSHQFAPTKAPPEHHQEPRPHQ